MKRLFFYAVMSLFAIVANAQTDVTKFMGIPVDGTKAEMIAKLKEKGFRPAPNIGEDYLEGTFNGREVYISPVTNGNKVWRISVVQQTQVDEGQIKIHFNNLCYQFKNNPKYTSLGDQTIPDKEDIRYEMIVNKKQYQAAFLPIPLNKNKCVWFTISENYGRYRLIIFYDNLYNQANGEDL